MGGACGNKGRREVRERGDWVNEKRELVCGDEGTRKRGRVKSRRERARQAGRGIEKKEDWRMEERQRNKDRREVYLRKGKKGRKLEGNEGKIDRERMKEGKHI